MPTFAAIALAACGYLAEKDDVASFNLRASCRKLLIISKQQHQIETGGAARRPAESSGYSGEKMAF